MATNYSFSEMVKILANGENVEAIHEIGKRFPVLSRQVVIVATKAGSDFVELMDLMPANLSVIKVNNQLKAVGAVEAETGEERDVPTEEAVPATGNYDSMSTNELWEILKGYGVKKKAGYVKKSVLIDMINEAANGTPAASAEQEDAEEPEEVEGYAAMSAVDLFKECKKRKIKAAPKKPVKFYIDLLEKDDIAKAEPAVEEDDDDDWGDEAEAVTPKPAAKPKVEEPAEDDDDDDWDI